jgi:hypothetical protein
MYCESCGKKIDESLNYCNGCGASIRTETRSQKSLAAFLIAGLTAITISGFLVLAILLAVLIDRVSPRIEPLFAFGAAFLFVLFGIAFLIMRQVSRVIDHELKVRELPKRKTEPLVQLPPKSTNPLDEFRQPASVTDHTTRTLDKVQR